MAKRLTNEQKIERLVLIFLNKSRSKRGISKLRTNFGLKRVARNHSKAMAKKGRIWHGRGVHIAKDNITRKKGFWNFLGSLLTSYNYGGGGENVAMMIRGNVRGFKKPIRTNKDIAYALHKQWMKSPGHRRNILDSNFSLIGVGVKKGRKGYYYATQLFYG